MTEINGYFKHHAQEPEQAHMQGFDCESITFKSAVDMFERMEIAEFIYEGVLKPYYKIPNRSDSNRTDHIRKMGG